MCCDNSYFNSLFLKKINPFPFNKKNEKLHSILYDIFKTLLLKIFKNINNLNIFPMFVYFFHTSSIKYR